MRSQLSAKRGWLLKIFDCIRRDDFMDIAALMSDLPELLKGTLVTIELTALAIIVGTMIGTGISMMEISSHKILSSIGNFYTWIFRGTPLLLQLFVFYYVFAGFGIEMTPIQAAVIGLSLNCAAYMAEIIRSGIQAIDIGQFEAARALGFTYFKTMRRIIIPQTIRIIIPSVGNQFIGLIKDTSLVSVVTMEELMRKANLQMSATGDARVPYISAAILYLLLTTIFTGLFSRVEKKLSVY